MSKRSVWGGITWLVAIVASCIVLVSPQALATDRYALDPDITTTLAPTPASVTLSTAAQPTYASYTVAIVHYSVRDELLKPVRFNASTTVVDAAGIEVAGQSAGFLVSSLPPGCALSASGPTAVECVFADGLFLKGSRIDFTLTVRAPSAGAQIRLQSQTRWNEPNEFDRLESEPVRSASTGLSAPDPAKVNSYVPPSTAATTLFTGVNGGAATPADTWTTTVTVPPLSLATTAEITEVVDPVTCAANLLDCSSSTLTIPGSFAELRIILRRDASTIAKNAKIGSARIFYDNPSHPDPRVTYPMQVPACGDTTFGTLPQPGIPCIASRTDHPNKATPKKPVPPGFEGDWEFVIRALDNGQYRN